MDLNRLRRDRGQYFPLPSPEEAMAYPYTEQDRIKLARARKRLFVGSPATVLDKLQPLITACQADEVMITASIYDHEKRKALLHAAGGGVRPAAQRRRRESRQRCERQTDACGTMADISADTG